MKRIILLRHAKTEAYDYQKDDFRRNLTTRGISDCQLIAHILKSNAYKIDTILSSDANRTMQTSELFAENFEIQKKDIAYSRKIYEGLTTQEMLTMVSKTKNEVQTLLFVGHNPDIARFAYRLTENFNYNVPTCCAIVLETAIDNWDELGNEAFLFQDIFIPKSYK